jgi:hypothetical protein
VCAEDEFTSDAVDAAESVVEPVFGATPAGFERGLSPIPAFATRETSALNSGVSPSVTMVGEADDSVDSVRAVDNRTDISKREDEMAV